MADTARCPVCGAAQEKGVGCMKCRFPLAFVRAFADASSYQAWQVQCQRAAFVRLRGQPLLAVSTAGLAVLNPCTHILRVYNRFGSHRDIPQVMLSGLFGSQWVAQPTARNLVYPVHDVTHVCLLPDCTLAVGKDGRVTVIGYMALKDEIERWESVAWLWCSLYCAAGILRDGSLMIAYRIRGGPVTLYVGTDRLGGKAVSAVVLSNEGTGTVTAFVLLEDGTVAIAICDNQESGCTRMQENIISVTVINDQKYTAIAATDDIVLLLGKDGRVRPLGDHCSFAEEVNAWTDIVLLTACDTCAAAVDIEGQLHLAGQSYYRGKLIGEEKWDPLFLLP